MRAVNDAPTVGPSVDGGHWPSALAPRTSAPLLYGLSLAVALPPAAWLAPPGGDFPMIHPTAYPVISAAELSTALSLPVAEAGRGVAVLDQIDRRLRGLRISFDLFRACNGQEALVTIGVVQRDSARIVAGGATPMDLWLLACTALPRFGQVQTWQSGPAADAIVAQYSNATIQGVCLTADSLTTVSVTRLRGAEAQTTLDGAGRYTAAPFSHSVWGQSYGMTAGAGS